MLLGIWLLAFGAVALVAWVVLRPRESVIARRINPALANRVRHLAQDLGEVPARRPLDDDRGDSYVEVRASHTTSERAEHGLSIGPKLEIA